MKVCLVAVVIFVLVMPTIVLGAGAGANYGLDHTAERLGYSTDVAETIPMLILQWLKIFLGFTSIIFLGYSLYAGVRWITARGKEELVTKAKETLQGSITGLIIIVMAFAIVNFVLSTLGVPVSQAPAPKAPYQVGCCVGNNSRRPSCSPSPSSEDCQRQMPGNSAWYNTVCSKDLGC